MKKKKFQVSYIHGDFTAEVRQLILSADTDSPNPHPLADFARNDAMPRFLKSVLIGHSGWGSAKSAKLTYCIDGLSEPTPRQTELISAQVRAFFLKTPIPCVSLR